MSRRHLCAAFASLLLLAMPEMQAGAEALPAPQSERILELHNQARDAENLPHLSWSVQLAKEAQLWAQTLASEGQLRHSAWNTREGTGENLWMGTAGYFGPDAMIGDFIGEKRKFRPGKFPNVSSTGHWEDVGHYTQIIWPATQQVGCAMARGQRMEVLVCRYWPAGNYYGQPVG